MRVLPALLVVAGTISGVLPSARVPRDATRASPLERVRPNDNRDAAGGLRDGVLELHLKARLAMWHPDGDDAPGAPVPAFAEAGGAPRIPGPLVRVRAGTVASVTMTNALRDTLRVHGLHARPASPADATPIVLAPGAQQTVRVRLDAPGTYHYWGTTTRRGIDYRTLEDAQLTGAIVVDPATGPEGGRAADRIFVLGMWADTVHRARTHRRRVLAVINGRSWPHTERLAHAVGDTVRWRVINGSADAHPMHLHGFYFQVDSRGDGRRDSVYAAGDAGRAVTELMSGGTTIRLTWIPERAGNWLFHCHVPEHFEPRGSLGIERPAAMGVDVHADHAKDGMNGLVMGIVVRPGRTRARPVAFARPAPVARAARRMRLLVRPNRGSADAIPLFGYALHEGGAEPAPDSGRRVGPTLDLVRGQPVQITVVNQLVAPTVVHWHGIELESYYDGVPGFSGAGRRLTPLIAPGDSFVVRFTPPRAGTFIYHTHADEARQQLAGLAGVLVVRDSAMPRDPLTDIPLLLSEGLDSAGSPSLLLVNGQASPPSITMRVGTSYRLRFVQMGVTRSALWVELWRDTAALAWRPVAKDGAALPARVRMSSPGRVRMGIGETYDVEVTPDREGDLRLTLRSGLQWPQPSPMLVTVPIRVLAAGAE